MNRRAAGGKGTIVATTNGGKAWVVQASKTNAFLFAFDFRSRNEGQVMGELDRPPGSDPWACGLISTTTMVARTGGDLVKKTTVVILLAALGMALAASCGTSAKDRLQSYVTDCKPQVESMVKTMGGLQNPFSSMSQTKDATWDTAAATLDSAVTAIQGAADGLGSITAPDALKTAHEQLIVGLEDIVKAFRTIGGAIKDGSFGATTMNDAALNKLLDDGTAKRRAWKTALEKQCKDLGVTITWKWE